MNGLLYLFCILQLSYSSGATLENTCLSLNLYFASIPTAATKTVYDSDNSTCYFLAANRISQWWDGFGHCTNVRNDHFPESVFPHLISRPVQIETQHVWDIIRNRNEFNETSFWTGLSTDYTLNHTETDHWMWYPEYTASANPNVLRRLSSDPLDPPLFNSPTWPKLDPYSIYGMYHRGVHRLTNMENYEIPTLCEIFVNQCDQNPSACSSAASECVPEKDTYRCVCPSGAVPVGNECLVADEQALSQAPYYSNVNVMCDGIQCDGNESCSSNNGCICSLSLSTTGDCIGECEHGYTITMELGCSNSRFTHCHIEKNCTGPHYRNNYIADTVNDWHEDCGDNGLFLGPECFEVIDTGPYTPWSQGFSLCAAHHGMRFAHIYNNDQTTFTTIASYLLKEYPDTYIWMGMKYNGTGYNWMQNENDALVAVGKADMDVEENSGNCMALSASSEHNMHQHPMLVGSFDCATKMLDKILCMKDTNYARFKVTSGQKMTATGSGQFDTGSEVIVFAERHDSMEYCLKRCRSRPYCLGINFGQPDKIAGPNCEVLNSNKALMDQTPSPVQLIANEHYTLYERFF